MIFWRKLLLFHNLKKLSRMSKFWVVKLLAISLFCHAGYAFLLDSSTIRPNGGSQYLTTRHYVQLMDSLYEEKQARHQLEQIVATLQTKIDTMNNNGGHQAVNITTLIQPYDSRLEKQEYELSALRNVYDSLLQTKETEIVKLRTKVAVLEQNYTGLMHDNTATQTNYQKLKLEVESLKQVKNLDVANGLQETKNEINVLKASNQARSQDFLALYNLTMLNNKDISIAKKKLNTIYNGAVIDTKINGLKDKIGHLEVTQNLTSMQVNTTVNSVSLQGSVIDTKIKRLNDKMNRLEISQNFTAMQVNTTIQILSTKAGFTACGGTSGSRGKIIFPTVKSSHGISVTSSYRDGKFSPEKEGFYLVLTHLLSEIETSFYIKKNGNDIGRAWAHYGDSSSNVYYSASISAFIGLTINDVITIEGGHLSSSSCLTIVQL